MYDYSKLPPHIRQGVKNYVEHRKKPGSFLTAVICNNLKESFGQADDINRECLYDIVKFFYWEVPAICWGSPERMKAWLEGVDG